MFLWQSFSVQNKFVFFCSSVYYYVTITFHLYSPVRTLAQHYQVNTELGNFFYCTCCHK